MQYPRIDIQLRTIHVVRNDIQNFKDIPHNKTCSVKNTDSVRLARKNGVNAIYNSTDRVVAVKFTLSSRQ